MMFKSYNVNKNAIVITYIPLCDLVEFYHDLRQISFYSVMSKTRFFHEFKTLVEISLMNE